MRAKAVLSILGLLVVLQALPAFAQRRVRPLDPLAAKMEPTRTVPYKTVEGRTLLLNVFEPQGHKTTDKRPVFLFLHGGGWTGMTPRYFYPFADHFARLGMVGISAEYRLMNRKLGVTVFDCVRDARSAARYVRRHAADLGIDPEQIVVGGGSAGGHLAAATALFDGVDEPGEDLTVSCRPDLLVLYYPVIDTSAEGYGQAKIGDRWRELSPVDHVKPGLPPTLLLHGTVDKVTPFAGAVRFRERMEKAGNEIRMISHEGGDHGYFIFDLDLFSEAMKQTETFLRLHGVLGLDAATRERCLETLRKGLHGDDFWPAMHAAEGLTLGGHGEEVRRFIVPRLPSETDDQRRCGLARELVRAGDSERSKILLGILQGAEPHGHVHAAESLYKVGWTGSDAALVRAFRDGGDIRLRLMAAAALAKHGGAEKRAEALAFLRQHFRSEPDPALWRLSGWVLGRVGEAADIALLRSRLAEAPDAVLRAFVEHALAALGDPEGRHAVLRNLRSEDPAVRTYAAVFAGETGIREALPLLVSQLDDGHPDARIRAAQALLVLDRGQP